MNAKKITNLNSQIVKNQKSKLKPDPIFARINRIEGQVIGIKRMYESKPFDCVGIVQQIQAVRSALNQVAKIILTDEAERCAEKGDIKGLERIVNKTFKTI